MNNSKFSRRDFIKTAAASAALTAAAPATLLATDSGFGGNKIPVGLQMYSVRNECQRDLEGTLKAAGKMGYKGIELAEQGLKGGYKGNDAHTLRKMLDDAGLKCCGAHTSFASLQTDALGATMEYHKILGTPFLIVPILPRRMTTTKAGWQEAGDAFNEIADKIKSAGFRVGYHNHTEEFTPVEGELPFNLIFNRTKKDVVIQCDIGHVAVAGADPVAILKRFPGRVASCHVRGYAKGNPEALVGEDDLPWKEIFSVCESTAGTEWYIVEDISMTAPLERAAKIFETMHNWGKC